MGVQCTVSFKRVGVGACVSGVMLNENIIIKYFEYALRREVYLSYTLP